MKYLILILLFVIFSCDIVRYPKGAYVEREKVLNKYSEKMASCFKAPVANGTLIDFKVDLYSTASFEPYGYVTHPVNILESQLYDRNCIHTVLQKVQFPVLSPLTAEEMQFQFYDGHWKFVPKKHLER